MAGKRQRDSHEFTFDSFWVICVTLRSILVAILTIIHIIINLMAALFV